MTKKLVNFLIVIYQNLTRSRFPTCRYSPTCSQYAIEAVGKYGLFKGSFQSIKRILNCHPFSKRPIYDPA